MQMVPLKWTDQQPTGILASAVTKKQNTPCLAPAQICDTGFSTEQRAKHSQSLRTQMTNDRAATLTSQTGFSIVFASLTAPQMSLIILQIKNKSSTYNLGISRCKVSG